ncbi:MAG: hypothetical protein AAF384_02340, partial [Pseudomonadota bacterium]
SYKYLGDLIEQLKVIDKDIEVDFNMPEIGNLKRMKQDEYVIGRIDAQGAIEDGFVLRWGLSNGHKHKIKGEGYPRIKAILDAFKENDVNHRVDVKRNGPQGPELAVIVFTATVKGSMRMIPNKEEGQIELHVRNHEKLEKAKHLFPADAVNDRFLDNLGRFLIHEEHDLFKNEIKTISDEERAALKAKLNQTLRSEERTDVDKLEASEPPAEQQKSGIFKRFRS